MTEPQKNAIEVRGFLQLQRLFRQRNWPIPLTVDLETAITGTELANKLGISLADIEVIFVNGFVQSLAEKIVPGDRVAFVPPGCPGPYRIHLGFYSHNQHNPQGSILKK
ncbi:MAG: MoaD/ThiS family protein [Bacillota bacterium]|nr:MoaD/ThiS family protein [Negativicutes bacterium]